MIQAGTISTGSRSARGRRGILDEFDQGVAEHHLARGGRYVLPQNGLCGVAGGAAGHRRGEIGEQIAVALDQVGAATGDCGAQDFRVHPGQVAGGQHVQQLPRGEADDAAVRGLGAVVGAGRLSPPGFGQEERLVPGVERGGAPGGVVEAVVAGQRSNDGLARQGGAEALPVLQGERRQIQATERGVGQVRAAQSRPAMAWPTGDRPMVRRLSAACTSRSRGAQRAAGTVAACLTAISLMESLCLRMAPFERSMGTGALMGIKGGQGLLF